MLDDEEVLQLTAVDNKGKCLDNNTSNEEQNVELCRASHVTRAGDAPTTTVTLASVGESHIMPPIPKRRKLSDITVGDTNELLYKLEEFRSSLDEGDENLPSGLFSKLQELRDKLEDVKMMKTDCSQR